MADLNNYAVIGRMTRDVSGDDFAYTTNGKARLNLSLAVNDGYGDSQYTSFFDVVVWGKTAENIKPYIGKGKQLCVCGRLRQDRWEKDGRKNSRVVIVAESVQLLGGRDNGGTSQSAPRIQSGPAETADGAENLFPEDIPF